MDNAKVESLRCVYCDLDGTLLGRAGSLFHDRQGQPTLLGARAVEACVRAEVELVLYSGRNRWTVFELARLFGQPAFIYEAGCGLVVDGEDEYLTGAFVPRDGETIHAQITKSGAPDALLEHYRERLEYHAPWHQGREISHLFRGLVDLEEAQRFLVENNYGQLRLVDNGVLSRASETLALEGKLHAYHLIPSCASKTRAVARHMQIRGYQRDQCIAIGDSREDLAAAEAVGSFWLVGNAIRRDPTLSEAAERWSNVRVAAGENGAGVYEAIIESLATS